MKLKKEQRSYVKAALVTTLSNNFPILSRAQVDGIAIHFTTHMCRVIAKCDNYIHNRSFTEDDLRNAFAEVLAKRILHIASLDEEPAGVEEELEDKAEANGEGQEEADE